jgi:3-hydroxyacyl-CoA dehydrogenase
MKIQKIVVFGAGILGTQIAFQISFFGFQVTLCDLTTEILVAAKQTMEQNFERYKVDMHADATKLTAALENINFTLDSAMAVRDADLLIESIPEVYEQKREFYEHIGNIAPEKTIFCTNSSILLPSTLANATGRPKSFLALHFANQIWKNNSAEVMGHPGTDPAIFQTITEFAGNIGMIPFELHKEQPGYILNSMLGQWISVAIDLVTTGVADFEAIDKCWMLGTKASLGPFAIIDIIGMTSFYNVKKIKADRTGTARDLEQALYIKENFLDQGKLGVSSGEGFYKYPNPAYLSPDLENEFSTSARNSSNLS